MRMLSLAHKDSGEYRPIRTTGIRGAAYRALATAAILIIFAGQSPARGQLAGTSPTHAAPLDTLSRTLPQDEVPDIRFQGGDIPISRKLLPQVTATTVPLARTPNQPPRLDDPMAGSWHFHLARQAVANGDLDKAAQEIKAARAADPGRAHYQWWQIAVALRAVDTPTLAQVIPEAFSTLARSTLARGRLLVRLHQVALLAVGWFWLVLILALYLIRWRHIAHDLGAMLFKNPRHPSHGWAPLLLPLAFLVVKPGFFGFLALMSVPLLIQTRGWSRGLLATVWITALALVYPAWPPLRNAVPAFDPQSEVVLLERACHLPPSGPIAESLRQRLASAKDPARKDRLAVALGIQEARRGNYKRSDKLFRSVLKHDPDNYSAQIGLANNTYYRGRLDKAADMYQKAAAAHPRRGETPFNLAQVYFKKLFVPEATDALEKARKLGFRMESQANPNTRSQGYSPVVYPPVTDEAMAEASRFEAAGYAPLVTISAWSGFLSALPWPLFLVMGIPLVVATFLVLWISHQNDPSRCDNCGVPLCRECAYIHEGAWLCSGCGETVQRSQSDMVLTTLFKNKSRSEGLKHIQRVINLGRTLPGTGHLAIDKFAGGWARLSLVAVGLFLVCGSWAFDPGAEWSTPGLQLPGELIQPDYLPLPTGAWNGWTGLPFLAGLGCLAIAWIIALADAARLRNSIPERTFLVPSGVQKDKQIQPGIDANEGVAQSISVR